MYIRKGFSEVLRRLQEPRRWIQVILGPRQVGKTTGTVEILKTMGFPTLYLAADDPTLRDPQWLAQQWQMARNRCQQSHKDLLLVIDEIQKIENWSEVVKQYWDEDSRHHIPLKVLLLGSSTLLLQKGLSESLSGRFELTRMMHWTYPEMKAGFSFSLEEWIYFGGYPGPVDIRTEGIRWASFVKDALIETTLSKDILLMQTITKPALLKRLFQLGCSYSGQILSFQKMLGQLHDAGNASTLAHYLDLLGQAGLLGGLEKFSGSAIRQKSSSPKFQVFNNALLSVLSSKTFLETKNDPELWGRHVESAIGAYLINLSFLDGFEVFYWRDRHDEVDFVITHDEKIAGVEVKSGRNKGRHPGLQAFKKHFPDAKTWVVGDAYGIPLAEFLNTPPRHWCD